ncbi:endonuclease/exonuclease/phosphatase family protein [Actinotignum urinale]|uniref:endonuclease/exonuclease/phosphatase family protein n=1 Tax=Actinotignum urinale TaxID=190146 RepID=UPI00370D7139
MRLLKWGMAAPIILLAIYTIQPAWFGPFASWATFLPGAQIIALRGWLVVGFAVLAVATGVLSVVFRCFGSAHATRVLALVLTGTALCHAGTIYFRGLGDDDLTVAPQKNDITVMQYNTEGGQVDFDVVADNIVKNHVQAVSLVETSTQAGKDMVKKLRARGQEFQFFHQGVSRWDSDWRSSVLLVNKNLGTYVPLTFEHDGKGTQRTLGARPEEPNGKPAFISVHPVAPVPKYMEEWREEVTNIYTMCDTRKDAIILGDFNSTRDHQKILGVGTSCTDLSKDAGIGGWGTWPAKTPSLLASPIDRVLTGGHYRGVGGSVLNNGGSDHRAVIVRIAPEK